MKRLALSMLLAAGLFGGVSVLDAPQAEAALSVSFIFKNHSRYLTSRQARRVRYYRRIGCRVFTLNQTQRRFALRSLSHAFNAMNDKRYLKIIRNKRFTYTRMSGAQIIAKIRTGHRKLPVFGYDGDSGCPVSHTATAFAIYKMIFLRATYLDRVRRTNNWRRLAQTLAHEWMHGVGFGHGRNGGQGTWRKRNSVPIFVGCLVKYFPKLKRGKQICSQAKGRYASRRYRRRRNYRRHRYGYRARRPRRTQPRSPFVPHRPGGATRDWLHGDSSRGSRQPRRSRGIRSPFHAPLRGRSRGDWLHGNKPKKRKTPKVKPRRGDQAI